MCLIDHRNHKYLVDFFVENINGKKYAIEIKSFGDLKPPKKPSSLNRKSKFSYNRAMYTYIKNLSKWRSAKIFCEKVGIKFVILTEKDIY
jgi:hypothetical protein